MKKKISITKNVELTVDEAFDYFIRKAIVRNLPQNTIDTYKCHLYEVIGLLLCKIMFRKKVSSKHWICENSRYSQSKILQKYIQHYKTCLSMEYSRFYEKK